MKNKRLFFSLEGVDINDDDALAAFAQRVWQQATAAFTAEPDEADTTTDNGQAPQEPTGDSHE